MSYLYGVPREQRMLLPDAVEDYVGAENPVRVVDAFVEGLNLMALGFDLKPEGSGGAPPYEPKAMLKLVCVRVSQSHSLEPGVGEGDQAQPGSHLAAGATDAGSLDDQRIPA